MARILKSAWLGAETTETTRFFNFQAQVVGSLYFELPRPKFVRTKDFPLSESLKYFIFPASRVWFLVP